MKKSPRGKTPALDPEQQKEYDTMKAAAGILRKALTAVVKIIGPNDNIFVASDLFVVVYRTQPGAAILSGKWFKLVP